MDPSGAIRNERLAKRPSGSSVLMASEPMGATMVEELIRRKQVEFAADHRLIGEYKLVLKNGGWILRAEARDPTPKARSNHRA